MEIVHTEGDDDYTYWEGGADSFTQTFRSPRTTTNPVDSAEAQTTLIDFRGQRASTAEAPRSEGFVWGERHPFIAGYAVGPGANDPGRPAYPSSASLLPDISTDCE